MTTMHRSGERRWLAFLGSSCVALLGACAFLGWSLATRPDGVFYGEEALRDPDIQREVIRKLAENNVMPLDSHPDPDVARLLLPEAERGDFQTNAIGMRERPFELQKPAGVVRIVLLGDSYVFGLNIPTAERLGAVLERALTERARDPGLSFECLHFGVNSWNIVSESAFLRRQVDQIQPDLVVQVTVSNDMDDVTGVRGFGTEATFAPAHRERADSLVMDRYAESFLDQRTRNFLSRGEDHESRSRFAQALDAVRGLRVALGNLEARPRHVLLVHWGPLAPVIHENLGVRLEPDSVLYTPLEFSTDKGVWLTPNDPHWNSAGHARVARLLYGWIRARGWLPGVELAPWPEAEREAEEWAERGLEFARTARERVRASFKDPVAALELPEFTFEEARQIQGGLDLEGLVSPYATFVLARPAGARELHIRGHALPDRVLRGTRTRVFLEELEVASVELQPDAAIALNVPIPPELDGRSMLAVRFSSDDWVYRGRDLRHCVVFRLERAALE